MAIQSFACTDTERLYRTGKSRRFSNVLKVVLRKVDMLDAAASLTDLRVPPGNRLEAFGG